MPKDKDRKPANFKSVRIFDKALRQSTEMIEDFQRQGHTASWTSVVNTALNLMHSTMMDKNFTLVSNREIIDRRAYDVGNCVAIVLATLCSAKVSMAGCQLAYFPEVDAIGIKMDAIDDVLIYTGGADPAAIANVVTDQLRTRGYLQGDDGAQFVDMDQLLQRTTS